MQINQHQKNVNFTSRMRLELIVDGSPCTDVEVIETAVHNLSKLITKPYKNPAKSQPLVDEFVNYDRAFTQYDGHKKPNVPIKFCIDRLTNIAYLFTDMHAATIKELGKKLGMTKCKIKAELKALYPGNAFPNEHLESLIKEEVKADPRVRAASIAYSNKIKDYLSPEYEKIMVRERINPESRMYEGEPVTLRILASADAKNIEKIKFIKDSELELENAKLMAYSQPQKIEQVQIVPPKPQQAVQKDLFSPEEIVKTLPKDKGLQLKLDF